MTFDIIDPNEFIEKGIFSEDTFLNNTSHYDWEKYRDKKVLIRGCTSSMIPPWAYMVLTGKLTEIAQSIRFGNEHDNVTVYRRKK